jgi:hypothetical protein
MVVAILALPQAVIEIPASQQTNSAQLHVQLESSNPTSSSHTVHLEAVRGSVQLAVAPYELVLLYGRLYGRLPVQLYEYSSVRSSYSRAGDKDNR